MEAIHQDAIKSAAQRMCAVFDSKGVKVKHSLMLEALAQGFGIESWRTLKAIVDAPRAEPKPVAPPLGTEQSWTVDAIYRDNDQPYGDECWGRTALEAAIDAIMERLTDFGNEIGIVNVVNVDNSVALRTGSLDEIKLYYPREALARLLAAVDERESRIVDYWAIQTRSTAETSQKHQELIRRRSWLADILETYPQNGDFSDLEDYDAGLTAKAGAKWEKGTIAPYDTVCPTVALKTLCTAVECTFPGLPAMEQKNEELAAALYQVQAMCVHFERNLDDQSLSLLVSDVTAESAENQEAQAK